MCSICVLDSAPLAFLIYQSFNRWCSALVFSHSVITFSNKHSHSMNIQGYSHEYTIKQASTKTVIQLTLSKLISPILSRIHSSQTLKEMFTTEKYAENSWRHINALCLIICSRYLNNCQNILLWDLKSYRFSYLQRITRKQEKSLRKGHGLPCALCLKRGTYG